MLDRAIEVRNDATMIPLSDIERHIPSIHVPVRWNQIVQRCGSSVTDSAFYSVWMDFVIKHLVFKSQVLGLARPGSA